MTGPDYIVIGAMKCGTSTLAAQLGAQQGLFMTTPKEPNYFSDDEIFARGPDWYAGLFATAEPGDLKGEASTHYTKLPTYPEALPRLAAAVPNPKLIYLIRDPVTRAVSHYIHEWTMGTIDRDTGIDAALDRHPEMISYGCYAMQIAPWIERFGAGRVHVETLEGMTADPQATLTRVGRFLGRGDLVWQHDLERVNVSSERLRKGPLDALLVDSAAVTWLRRRLVPQSLRDRIKAGRRLPGRPQFSAANRSRLETVFLEDRERLHALIPGRPDLDLAWPFAAAVRP